jgi:hypothetical protein
MRTRACAQVRVLPHPCAHGANAANCLMMGGAIEFTMFSRSLSGGAVGDAVIFWLNRWIRLVPIA